MTYADRELIAANVAKSDAKLRFAYIKNGDAVEQVQRLLPFTSTGPSDGPDAFVYDLLRRWRDASILVMSRANADRYCHIEDVEARVFRATGHPFCKPLYRLSATARLLFRLLRFQPDRLLCGTTGGPLWISFLVARWRRIPLVHSRHNRVSSPDGRWLKTLSDRIDRWVIRKAAAIICHGPFLKDEIVRIGIPAARVFEFDVSFEDHQENQTVERPHDRLSVDSCRLILYVGRIEVDKGVFDLLEAVRERLQTDAKLRLTYVGDGSQLERLRASVSQYGLEGKVSVPGYMDHGDLDGIYKNARALVTPSQGRFPEGRCMSAMESLVAGVPVVAPDYGPFPFLVKSGENGLLYRTDDIADMMVKINQVLDDESLYQRLKDGAWNSGRRLLRPQLTFAQSVECAFSASG